MYVHYLQPKIEQRLTRNRDFEMTGTFQHTLNCLVLSTFVRVSRILCLLSQGLDLNAGSEGLVFQHCTGHPNDVLAGTQKLPLVWKKLTRIFAIS